MTRRGDCAQAEKLAGAVALGEAGNAERDAYRSHLAGCRQCLDALGGEREIERVMAVAARARDSESWEPDLRASLVRRTRPRRAWALAAVLAAAALVVGLRITLPRDFHSPAAPAIMAQEARALAALNTQSIVRPQGRAESLAVGTTTVSTAFEVRVNARGVALRCVITRSSGYRALDDSVCRAAMHAHYSSH